MVAVRKLDESSKIDIVKLSEHVEENLPRHARPLFLRIIENPESWDLQTNTLKLRKSQLQQ